MKTMRMMRHSVRVAVAASLALMASGSGLRGAPLAGATRTGLPRFEAATCPFTLGAGLVAGQDVRCGYLVVPADRRVRGGPTLRLAVAIVKSPAAQPAPDPTIYLNGGPGAATLSTLGPRITAATLPYWVGDRDLVLLDQRGTGFSHPALECPEVSALADRTLDHQLSRAQQIALSVAAARRCHDRLTRAGIALRAYTTLDDAADVADLRRALGYARINLYGVSYGTRLALTTMRLYPAGIRSVILDSVLAPQVNSFTGPQASAQRAFDALFAGCRAASDCARAYPQLDRVFYGLVARLNAAPATLRVTSRATGRRYTVALTGDQLALLVFRALYATPVIPALPKLLVELRAGRTAFAARLYAAVALDTVRGIDTGMYLSVQCAEDAPYVTRAQVVASARPLAAALRPGLLTDALADLDACAAWHVPPLPPAQKRPVVSAIPTLVLAGAYDPITEPAYGAAAARTLRHSTYVLFPGMGHGVRFAGLCPLTISAAFLDAPTQPPDASCADQMAAPAFLLPAAPDPF